MLFGMNAKELVIGGMSIVSLGIGVTNTVMGVKTSKQVKALRTDMDKYVLEPIKVQQAQQAVASIPQGTPVQNNQQ